MPKITLLDKGPNATVLWQGAYYKSGSTVEVDEATKKFLIEQGWVEKPKTAPKKEA